ncbi:MAG TPA: DEAD/DEAH box helicase [Candidatus Cloacimonadota bacterium]|nr:DEAD/DEAH box helicase [Candidatus Cloacimonadota bacterium]HPS38634.1 DEAD/DEAH box helicase [Candidatus Cloacimonadota bacterium]
MARLFSKDFHELSTSWYFNHAVIGLENGDLLHWKYKDENELIHLRFFSTPQKKEYFSAVVDVTYDQAAQTIVRHSCSECRDDDACRHYLSILRYSYYNLKTDIFEEPIVETCFGNALRAGEEILSLLDNSRIQIEGIFNPDTDKIRFYYDSYDHVDIPALIRVSLDEEIEELESHAKAVLIRQREALGDAELRLWQYVHTHRVSQSSKGKFYSLSKQEFPAVLAILQNLGSMAVVRETAEPLHFVSQPYNLSLRIEPSGKKGFRVHPIIVDELSIWYAGFPTWLFFRNSVHNLYLPLQNEIIDQIFAGGKLLSVKELVYWRTIVYRELRKYDLYLDFDERITLPEIIDEVPRIRLKLSREFDLYHLAGSLIYRSGEELPLSVIRFHSPLVRLDSSPANETEEKWFRVPHQTVTKVENLYHRLPDGDMNRLEQFSEIVFSGKESVDHLKNVMFELNEDDWDIEIDPVIEREFVHKAQLTVEIEAREGDDIDWFAYNVRYRYKDITFTHEELKQFFRTKEDFLHTQDGRLIFIANPELFHEMDKLITTSERNADQTYRARLMQLPYYQRLQQDNPEIRIMGDSYLEKMSQDLVTRRLSRAEHLPGYLETVLRSYQKAGYSWLSMLANYQLSGILADEMGLGKTIQALSVLANASPDSVSLVICPKTLLYNWAAEIEKFHTNISYQIVEGGKETRLEQLSNPNVQLFIMSYSLVLNDLQTLKDKKFDWIVLDEAQNIKNTSAQRTSAIKKLKSRHRMALSGTPIENDLTELWSIFDFLMPGYLGSLNSFKREHIHSDDHLKNRQRLHLAISPFLLRRIKKDVLLELPDKQEQVSWCKLNPIQEKLYLQILDSVQKKLFPDQNSAEPNYIHILAALTKLRQVCNHPSLANPDMLGDPELSAKLELMMEIVRDSLESGHKVLVFSQFVQMLRIIRQEFDRQGYRYAYMDGQTKDRMNQVNMFNSSPDIPLFLISLKTGGTGLNLTSADTVILFDPWWNPQVEQQAIDRTHRIGQLNKVNVYRLITLGTVEEKILKLQEGKRDLFRSVIEDGQQLLKNMTGEDIRRLFDYQPDDR